MIGLLLSDMTLNLAALYLVHERRDTNSPSVTRDGNTLRTADTLTRTRVFWLSAIRHDIRMWVTHSSHCH